MDAFAVPLLEPPSDESNVMKLLDHEMTITPCECPISLTRGFREPSTCRCEYPRAKHIHHQEPCDPEGPCPIASGFPETAKAERHLMVLKTRYNGHYKKHLEEGD